MRECVCVSVGVSLGVSVRVRTDGALIVFDPLGIYSDSLR